MPKKKRSKSPVKTDRPKYKELTSAESRHIALWESLAGRVPPFRMKQVVEQNVKSPRAISEVSTRLARQAAEYEASALFQVAADKYHRSAKYRMEEQDRQASATAQEHAYQEKQRAMRQREEEERLEAKQLLAEYSRQVAEDAEVRRQKKIEMMQVRERRAAQRLREQAQLAREEQEHRPQPSPDQTSQDRLGTRFGSIWRTNLRHFGTKTAFLEGMCLQCR